jgi:AbrB family looped-hinge helix DNA binding protein
MDKFNRFKRYFKLFAISKVGPKGQVVVPAEARAELDINPGDNVVVMGFLDKKAVMIVKEEVFEDQMRHVRRHFSFLDEYENLKKDQAQAAKFDD